MCLKLVVWALTWEEAMDRGLRALDDMRLQG
jgi:pyruvate carboxylase subunit A